MRGQHPIPDDIEAQYEDLINLIDQRDEINQKINELKQECNKSELLDNIKTLKEEIYDYMIEHQLEKIGSYTISFFKSRAQLKEEKNERKADKFKEIIEAPQKLNETEVDEIVEEIINFKLK